MNSCIFKTNSTIYECAVFEAEIRNIINLAQKEEETFTHGDFIHLLLTCIFIIVIYLFSVLTPVYPVYHKSHMACLWARLSQIHV